MGRGLSIAIMIMLLALVAAGCGGGSDESTGAGEVSAPAGSRGAQGAGESAKPNAKRSKKGSQSPESTDSPSGSEAEARAEAEPTQPSGEGQRKAKKKKKNSLSPEKRFARQANAICEEGRKKLLTEVGKYLQQQGSQSNRQQALREVTGAVLVPGMEAQIEALRRLGPPPAGAGEVRAFLATWERSLRSAAGRQQPLLGAYAEKVLAPAAALARKAGLTRCTYS